MFDGEYITFSQDGSVGTINYITGKFWCNHHIRVINTKQMIKIKYLYHYLNYMDYTKITKKNSIPNIPWTLLKEAKIKTPSLSDQQKIIDEIEKIQSEQSSYANYSKILQEQINNMNATIKNICLVKKQDENAVKQVNQEEKQIVKKKNKSQSESEKEENSESEEETKSQPKKIIKKKKVVDSDSECETKTKKVPKKKKVVKSESDSESESESNISSDSEFEWTNKILKKINKYTDNNKKMEKIKNKYKIPKKMFESKINEIKGK
jgi:hypothetical protein